MIFIKKYNDWLLERKLNEMGAGGKEAGSIEVLKTTPSEAWEYLQRSNYIGIKDLFGDRTSFIKKWTDLIDIINKGEINRKDMPVIPKEDIMAFKHRLEAGTLDIKEPYSSETDSNNPFPVDLGPDLAKKWLESGLHDGDKEDDKIPARLETTQFLNLHVIQKQIYFDAICKKFQGWIDNGKKVRKKLSNAIFIVSQENFILDGNHRYFGGMLIDPKMECQILKVDLPIDTLLPMSLTYTRAIGNKPNQ